MQGLAEKWQGLSYEFHLPGAAGGPLWGRWWPLRCRWWSLGAAGGPSGATGGPVGPLAARRSLLVVPGMQG